MIRKLLCCGVFLMTGFVANSQTTVDIDAEIDNSIYSESDNSSGVGQLYSGNTCSGNTRRALIQFDVAAILPIGAVVTDVTLTLNCNNVSMSAVPNDYSIHVLSVEWGEGASTGGGLGTAAIAPDATWTDAMFGTDTWGVPGGDFVALSSATTTLPDVVGDASWSSVGMVTDVQNWLSNPSTNFGWILIGDEAGTCSARRFGSKDEGVEPVLEVTYTCAGGDPLAVCQSVTVYLDDAGEGTILDSDLDGGSEAICGGALAFSASQTAFICDDIFEGAIPPSMIISAVYDGPIFGGLPKGIELYVVNDIADISIYGLGSANNGGGTDGEEFTFPAVSASAGTYIYVASEAVDFENWFGFAPDYTAGAMVINGDDAIELFLDGSVTDVFGEIDVDGTGEPWEYVDGWAYRVSDTGPDGATFTISNWMFSGINALDGETSNASAATPIPVGTFTTAPTIGVPVTLTVTDVDLNTSTCVTTVMVFDTLPPLMSCVTETTFILDETGMIVIDPSDLDAGTTDGCGIDFMSISMSTFLCDNAGENDVTLYATDIYGNIDSCTATVIIDASEVILISDVTLTDPTCFGFSDGTIDLSATGGTPAYTYDWDNDGTGDFDDDEDLVDLEDGIYIVVVKDSEGCESTETFTVEKSFVEILEMDDAQIKVYPNPVSDNLTIELESEFTYQISDINGKIIMEGTAQNKTTVSLKNVPRGTYVIDLFTDGSAKRIKLVKD